MTPQEPLPPEDEPLLDGSRRPSQKPGEKPKVRRSSPLGLMAPAEPELPRESGLPSKRAVGIMAGFMIGLILIMVLVSRGCA